MKKPPHVIEIFLQPGEFYFGDRDIRIRTVLGSCVSITMWHPRYLIGGMCHYMLPLSLGRREKMMDGKYADEAFALLLEQVKKHGTSLNEYEVKLFGGGDMFAGQSKAGEIHIGSKNAAAGKQLLLQHGVRSVAEDLCGAGHRTVIFDIWSGHVWVRQLAPELLRCDRLLER